MSARRSIATASGQAYRRTMTAARLFRFLILLSLLTMSFGMTGGSRAMAMDHAGAAVTRAEHCAGSSREPDDRSQPRIDCMLACAVLPAVEAQLAEPLLPTAATGPPVLIDSIDGIHPGADPPPPRHS